MTGEDRARQDATELDMLRESELDWQIEQIAIEQATRANEAKSD